MRTTEAFVWRGTNLMRVGLVNLRAGSSYAANSVGSWSVGLVGADEVPGRRDDRGMVAAQARPSGNRVRETLVVRGEGLPGAYDFVRREPRRLRFHSRHRPQSFAGELFEVLPGIGVVSPASFFGGHFTDGPGGF
jgi:hypothetical protein